MSQDRAPLAPPSLAFLKGRQISLKDPLPWRTRIGLLIASLALLAVACTGEPPPPLTPLGEPGGISISRVEPSSVAAAGAERVTLHGTGFAAGQVVWVGERLVTQTEVGAEGTTLSFMAPSTKAGAAFDLGVGTVGADERPATRVVAGEAYRTGGVSATGVAWIAVALALLALLGTPLFVVIAGVTFLGLFLEAQLKPDLGFFTSSDGRAGVGSSMFISWLGPMGDSPLFIAIPLFTFAGTLMSESQAPTRMINLCRALLGWLPGGLAVVTLVACCFFTAFTGASGVTIIALGGLLFPILLREQYPERFSLGLLTTGGSLGLLFPPSLPVIVYGLVARVDVGRLFVAAIVPGIILVGFLIATSFVVAVRSKVPRHAFTFGELGSALRGAAWELPLPVLVVGGIYSGLVTAAEASALAAAYVLFTTVVVYKDVPPQQLFSVVRKTAVLVGAILMIMGTALGFTDWLTLERVPQRILEVMSGVTDWFTALTGLPYQITFLIMLNVFLLIVGCLMDIFSATLVVVPLIGPVAHEFGVDPYHLAVVFLVNLEIGYSTPPVGINLFIASLRFRRPVFALYRASLLFIGVLLVALMLITYLPGLSLGFFKELPRVELLVPVGAELEGTTVKRVYQGGWADRSGLLPGDELLELEGEALSKRTLRERLDGGRGTKTLLVRRGAAQVEVSLDFTQRRNDGEAMSVSGDGILHARVEVGGIDLAEAKARRARALTALRSEEERLGASFDELDAALKAAEERYNTAKDADARAGERIKVNAAREACAPLKPFADALSASRRLVDDLQVLARTLKWRSRLDGQEFTGSELDLSRLGPGEHVLSATAQDKRRHVAQAVVRVTLSAGQTLKGPDPSASPSDDGSWGDGSGGDGSWGDDDDDQKSSGDGSWGDDDDDDAGHKKSSNDGSWGDDDDDAGHKRAKTADDGSWGDDDDDARKSGK